MWQNCGGAIKQENTEKEQCLFVECMCVCVSV